MPRNIKGGKKYKKGKKNTNEQEQDIVKDIYKILKKIHDKNVKAILINIFGGIMRCDVLALGVVEAAKEMKIDIPLVVRLAGTNYEKGKKILDDSKLKIISASDLSEAAKKVVEITK